MVSQARVDLDILEVAKHMRSFIGSGPAGTSSLRTDLARRSGVSSLPTMCCALSCRTVATAATQLPHSCHTVATCVTGKATKIYEEGGHACILAELDVSSLPAAVKTGEILTWQRF